jgi:diketogulonate reductase-like aldo/keto reductase
MACYRAGCRKAATGANERLGIKAVGLFTLRGPVSDEDLTHAMHECKALVDEGLIIGVGLSEVRCALGLKGFQ